jgi:hypothetical protein
MPAARPGRGRPRVYCCRKCGQAAADLRARLKLPPPAAPRGQVTTTDCDYSDDERELLLAMERYKRATGKKFPTYTEVLSVLRGLGYRKETT